MAAVAPRDPSSIVVIDWSMIGDLVMLSPCIRAIRQRYPAARLALLGQASSISPYACNPQVDELITYDRSRGDRDLGSFFKTARELRNGRFDMAFIFHNSIGSALMAVCGRVRQRVGYRNELRDWLLTSKYRIPDTRQHLIETKAQLLREYGVPVISLAEEVFINEDKARDWLVKKLGPNFGRSRPIIAIAMGATRSYKRWSASRLNTFLNLFPVNSCDFVFLGSPADRELFNDVYSYNNTVVDLVGRTTIEELTWVLDRADAYVGPDSGPMHLAIGRGTAVVGLFGPTDPARCGPFEYEQAVCIRSHKICKDCERHHGKNIRQCLHTLEADEVYCGTVELLGRYCTKWRPA